MPGFTVVCRQTSPSYGCTTCPNRIKSFDSKPPVHSLEIVGHNHHITKKSREFSNWPFNEIVKGLDEQRPAFIGETIAPWSMLTLHVEDVWYNKTNEVLRFITVPIHNSLAPLRVLNPFDHVVCWIAEATGKLWWTTRARRWWDHPLNTESQWRH